MISAKQLNKAFITKQVENDLAIEKAVYRNIKRISDKNIREIHKNILSVLSIESSSDSTYFLFEKFNELYRNEERKYKERIAKREQKNNNTI